MKLKRRPRGSGQKIGDTLDGAERCAMKIDIFGHKHQFLCNNSLPESHVH